MNVLILSCNTGGGHNAAARAIAEELRREGHEYRVVDYLALGNEGVSRRVSKAYVSTVNHAPLVFHALYKVGAAVSSPSHHSPVYYLNKSMVRFLKRELARCPYDAVVATHLFPAQALTVLRRKGKLPIPFIAVCTDYTCIPFWEETECDRMIIPHQQLCNEFIEHGVPVGRIQPIGIPVSLACNLSVSKEEARQQLELPADKPIILMLSGSMGHGKQDDLIKSLLERKNFSPYIVVVCGSNEKALNQLQHHFGKNENVRLMGFEHRIPLFLRACDVVITKPGGLTSTEAAVVGTPIVFSNAIPGCETKNQNFFLQNGLAFGPQSVWAQSQAARILATNKEVSDQMLEAQRLTICPNAAEKICQLIERMVRRELS